MRSPVPLLTLLLAAPVAAQAPYVETFEGNVNLGHWTLETPTEGIVPTGGHPGAHLRAQLTSFAPQPQTGFQAGPFAGDWAALGVASIGLDLRTYSTLTPVDRVLSVVLVQDFNTLSTADDVAVFFHGTTQVPEVAEGWRSVDLFVDSTSPSMPPGWDVLQPVGMDPDSAWALVIHQVRRVRFHYGDPTVTAALDVWDLGIDNARILTELPTSTYCVARPTSGGCVPAVSLAGTASVSSPAPFQVDAGALPNRKNGLLFYGFATDNQPFQNGTLCVAPPIRRTPVQFSGGSVGPDDCSGAFAFDFNLWIQSGADPALVEGAQVFAQYWFRDPPSASGSGLSDAAQFTIQA